MMNNFQCPLLSESISSTFYKQLLLSLGVNFINVLRARFLYKSKLISFSLNTFGFLIFGAKILYEKCLRKTLMKMTIDLH